MIRKRAISHSEKVFARLGRDLSATASAVTAAEIIVNAANELIGWDACYLVLYDPEKGEKPRPLLTIDTTKERAFLVRFDDAPDAPSENMLKAIREDGYLSLYDREVELPPHKVFGDTSRRTLSQLYVPVRTEARTLGVLSIQSYRRRAYDARSLETLKTLATHCAGALERIWAQEAANHLAERLKALYRATHAISASLDMEAICAAIHSAVEQAMPCDDFVIDGYDPETNEIVPIYAIEHPRRRVATARYRADHGLAGHIVHTREAVALNSREEMQGCGIRFEVYGSEAEDPTQSVLAAPMIFRDRVTGMISAQAHKANAYSNDDLYLLELLAAHAAIAIENSRLFATIQRLANTDSLTGALTRRRFFELGEGEFLRAKRYNAPLSVLMLDVDEFKSFNDRFGHQTGDRVLKMVAERCMSSLRSADIFGRLGGEEFAVILPETPLPQAEQAARRLSGLIKNMPLETGAPPNAMDEPVERGAYKITVSVGVACCDDACRNFDGLLDYADRAMYIGKNSGRNRIHVWGKSAGK